MRSPGPRPARRPHRPRPAWCFLGARRALRSSGAWPLRGPGTGTASRSVAGPGRRGPPGRPLLAAPTAFRAVVIRLARCPVPVAGPTACRRVTCPGRAPGRTGRLAAALIRAGARPAWPTVAARGVAASAVTAQNGCPCCRSGLRCRPAQVTAACRRAAERPLAAERPAPLLERLAVPPAASPPPGRAPPPPERLPLLAPATSAGTTATSAGTTAGAGRPAGAARTSRAACAASAGWSRRRPRPACAALAVPSGPAGLTALAGPAAWPDRLDRPGRLGRPDRPGRLDRPGRSGCLGPPSGRNQSRTRAVVRRAGPSNRRPAARARSRPPSAPSQASHARRHTGAYNVKPFRTNGVPTHGRRTEGRYQHGSGPQHEDVRRRPTLPRGPPRSTIGAEGLNFRVRNGTGCFPFAMATETLWRCQVVADRTSGTAQWTHAKSISRSQATRPISTGQLHTSPCFHLRPINPVV